MKRLYLFLLCLLISVNTFAAGGWHFTATKPHFEDSVGVPLAGGDLNFYECSTSTPKAVYPTKADAEAGSNPFTSVTLNSRGEPNTNVFVTGCVKVELLDASDVEIHTVDNLYGMDDLTTNSTFLVEHNSDGTHNISVPSDDNYYPVHSAADQGVDGSNNTINYYYTSIGTSNKATVVLRHNSGSQYTDYVFSTTADYSSYSNITLVIEPGARLDLDLGITVTLPSPSNAIASDNQQIFTGDGTIRWAVPGKVPIYWTGLDLVDAVATHPSEIYIPSSVDSFTEFPTYATGNLYISDTCDLGTSGVKKIYGDGPNSVIFSQVTDGSNLMEYTGSGNESKFTIFENFRIVGTAQEGIGINISPTTTANPRRFRISSVSFRNIGSHDIFLGNQTNGRTAYTFLIDHCYFKNSTDKAGRANIYIDKGGPQGTIKNNEIWGIGDYGIYIREYDRNLSILDNSFQLDYGTAIHTEAGFVRHSIHIMRNHFELCELAIYFIGTGESLIEANTFYNNTLCIDITNNSRELTLSNNQYQSNTNDIQLTGSLSDYRSYIKTEGEDSTITPSFAGVTASMQYTNMVSKEIKDRQIWALPSSTKPLQSFKGYGYSENLTDNTMVDILDFVSQTGTNNKLYHGILAGTITLVMTGAEDDGVNGAVQKVETFQVLISKWKSLALTAVVSSYGSATRDPGVKTPVITLSEKSGATATALTLEAKVTFSDYDNADFAWNWNLTQFSSEAGEVVYPELP